MNNNQWNKAKQLAARQYFTVINREETEEGERYYVAVNPDFPGCIADGQTPEEAKQELAKARIDFIYFMLEDNLVIPEPKTYEVKISPERVENFTTSPEQEQAIPYSNYIVEDAMLA